VRSLEPNTDIKNQWCQLFAHSGSNFLALKYIRASYSNKTNKQNKTLAK
jgi:hypothetical protein